ncbi:MAG: proteasome subunit beta [Candidatus Diapherotrites archaeon]
MTQDIKTGTTTVGLIFNGGVVLAADQRASMGHIAYDDEAEKIYKINDKLAVTNAGNVGDSLAVIRFLKSHARIYELERNETMTARAATTFLSNILNGNRYAPYIVQLVIGGFNSEPELFDLTPYGGILERDKYAVSGSGTEQALNTLDLGYKKDMSEKEGIALAVKAIESGKRRDLYSGGVSVTVFVIDSKGVRQLSKEQADKVSKEVTTA